ncbi:phage late control D family protein, partial [Salmonella enterica subsp. enterica serovar Kisarawe]|nr:phage late control D family protein [Salmonella enterica subsp. enterica serovar Kisarawe]
MTPTDAITLKINSYMDTLNDAVKVPDFSITVGEDELDDLNKRVMSVSMTDNRGFEADQVVISVDDADGGVWLPKRGTKLTVSMGWKGEPLIYKGLYIVDDISHEGPPDHLEITASSADFRAEFNVKREVSWHDVTVGRVVSAIAHRYGLKAQISDMLMDIEIDHADQTQESDMSFLTRMADMLGAVATVKNGSLLFILPGGGITPDGRALPSFALTRSHGDRHRFRISDRQAYTGV